MKKRKKEYAALLEHAMRAQRAGNIERYSELTKQAEDLMHEMDQIAAATQGPGDEDQGMGDRR
ncbi:MAG: hypothetical protein KC502_20490 [Myxococcales bacterium]|nr:hypothetical protein [Myxococcales bacterium]